MSLIVPPCSNTNAVQIQMMNSLNEEVAQNGALASIVSHISNNSERREQYYNLYMDFSWRYRNIYEKCPTSAIGRAAILESIHCEFCAVIIDYAEEDFNFVAKAVSKIQDKGQYWKIDNLQDYLDGDALDASLCIKGFGTFTYYSAGYLMFNGEHGAEIRIAAKSAC